MKRFRAELDGELAPQTAATGTYSQMGYTYDNATTIVSDEAVSVFKAPAQLNVPPSMTTVRSCR